MNDSPIEDKWEDVRRVLEEAFIEGHLNDKDLAARHAWPRWLDLSEDEREAVGDFARERVYELLDEVSAQQAVPASLLGLYIMNTLLTGMSYQIDRDQR